MRREVRSVTITLSAFSPNYDRALVEVEKALQVKPDDAPALGLRRTIEFARYFQNARQLERDSKYASALTQIAAALKLNPNDAEALSFRASLEKSERDAAAARAEARRVHPEQVFREANARLKLQYAELFQVQTMQFSNSIERVHSGILRALGQEPTWSVIRDNKENEDTVVIQARLKSFGSKKNVLLVAGQSADNEVTVYFKLIDLVLDTKIQISLGGISEDSYRPLHPQHVNAIRAPFAEKQRTASIQEFKKRIENELSIP